MNKIILFFLLLSVSLYAVVYISSFYLAYPVWFYLPAIIRKWTNPTNSHRPISWLQNIESPTIPQVSESSNDKRPNIVLIIADDLGVNDLSGGAGVSTPNIDSIRDNGVHYSKGYSGHATCAPSRAAIMTGRYATRFGFEFTPVPKQFAWILERTDRGNAREAILHREEFKNTPLMKEMSLPKSEKMLSEVLADEGYRNYYLGKWHLGETNGFRPLERGFHESLAFLKGGSLYARTNDPNVVLGDTGFALDDFLTFNLEFGVSHNNGPYFEPDIYLTDYLSREASTAIKQHSLNFGDNKPFFMTLAYNAPHDPFQALVSDYESEEVRDIQDNTARIYAAMIKALDRGVGQVLNTLRETNQYDNTLVIFTSDNGAATYLGLKESNKPFRGGKATLFEGGIRVPFFMQWPNRISSGIVYEQPVAHVDIYGTVSSAAGVITSSHQESRLDGRNLLPYLDALTSTSKPRLNKQTPHESLYWRSGSYRALLFGDWKLQVSERQNKVWLYNLISDPYEKNNLAEGCKWIEDIVDRILPHTEVPSPERMFSIFTNSDCEMFSSPQSITQELDNAVVNFSGDIDYQIDSNFSSTMNEMTIWNQEIRAVYKQLRQILEKIDSDQSKPLWPSLVETPIPIDKSKLDVLFHSDEFIYWAN